MSVASGAHALHDGYTDLIYVMLPVWQAEFGLTLRRRRHPARPVRRHHGESANSRRTSFGTLRCRADAGRRHRAHRSRLLPRRPERQLRDAARRAADRRHRRQHPASDRLGAGGARVLRPALAEGAGRLQFRRRHRQDDGAGARSADDDGHAVAARGDRAGRGRLCRSGPDPDADAALRPGRRRGEDQRQIARRCPRRPPGATPSRRCFRSA